MLSLQTGAIGQLKQLEAQVLIPSYLFNSNDIRFKAKLAGIRGQCKAVRMLLVRVGRG